MNEQIERVRSEALDLGFTLRPLPPTVRLTARQVGDGYDTTVKIAGKNGITVTTAHMRLRTAERFGVIRVAEIRAHPSGGTENVWEAVE